MIFYFSGSGSSERLARKLGSNVSDRVISMSEALRFGETELAFEKGEKLGFVFPVYFYGVPTVVLDFVKKAVFANKPEYTYLLLVCGGSTANTVSMFADALSEKGITLDYSASVKMPDNYVLMYDVRSPEENAERVRKAETELHSVEANLEKNNRGDFDELKGSFPAFWTRIVYLLYKYGRNTKKFHVLADKCIHCGFCEKVCPTGTIKLNSLQLPEWTKPKCSMCLACLHRCPVAATQYGKATLKRGRYADPTLQGDRK